MDKTQIINRFNEHFLEFITDIELAFPDDSDIGAVKKVVNRGLLLMPKMAIKAFKDYFIDEYSNEIDKGDLDFFINNDYKTKNVLFQKDSSKIIFDKIECLREPVSRLDPSEKAKIVKYLQNLKGLSDVYDSMKNN
jgi:hypothetical protein